MPEDRSGHLPAVQGVAEVMALHLDGKLVDILGIEVVPNVVVAGSIIASEIAGQGRKNPSGGEGQESAVRNGVHAAAEIVVNRALDAVREALGGRQLKAVVVAVGTGGELGYRARTGDRPACI